jgi:hypothetical protein
LHLLQPVAVDAPERGERAVEHREVVAAMDEQRAAGVIDVLPSPEVYVLQGLCDVEQTPDVNFQPEGAQQAAEDEHVPEEGGHFVT